MPENKQEERKNPQWIIVEAVAATILVGTFLLMLPFASRSGEWTSPLTALFMATSATCVTGHAVVDVGSYFSHFGQLVLLGLCQVGGLGFMTMATFLLILAGRRLSIQNEMMLMNTLGVDEADELKQLLRQTITFTFICEGIGAGILAVRLMAAHEVPFLAALYHGIFHSICAFCNAGFSLYPDNLIGLREDKIVLLTVAALIVLGGIGFLVVRNCGQFKFWRENRLSRGRLALHSRVVLIMTAVLVFGGAALFAALEWNHTLAKLGWPDRLLCAVFQSVTARTAGFNVVDMAQTHAATRFMTDILMFIGGSPGSIAGGIKTTTVVILLSTMVAMIRGRREVVLMGRTIAVSVLGGALAVCMLGIVVVVALYGALLITEQQNLLQSTFTADALLFDTISAFGTVGLTTNIMPALTAPGKLLMILCMFIGRCGPLTIALVVGVKEKRQLLRYPEEDVMIG
jgi:trk system potassium uptake protein TrkH